MKHTAACPQNFPKTPCRPFEAAFAQGYTYVELDPAFTSDGHCVVFHDHTVNRTCRAADGKALEKETRLCDLSYEQTQKLDAGIAKAYKFRGTKIPLLSEVLTWAKQTGVTVKIDNRVQAFSQEQALPCSIRSPLPMPPSPSPGLIRPISHACLTAFPMPKSITTAR